MRVFTLLVMFHAAVAATGCEKKAPSSKELVAQVKVATPMEAAGSICLALKYGNYEVFEAAVGPTFIAEEAKACRGLARLRKCGNGDASEGLKWAASGGCDVTLPADLPECSEDTLRHDWMKFVVSFPKRGAPCKASAKIEGDDVRVTLAAHPDMSEAVEFQHVGDAWRPASGLGAQLLLDTRIRYMTEELEKSMNESAAAVSDAEK